MRRGVLLFIMVVLLSFGLWTETAAQNSNETYGFVRFTHSSVDAPNIDIYVKDQSTPLVTNLAYGDTTKYFALPTTTKGLVVRAAGAGAQDKALYDSAFGIKSNTSMLIAAVGLQSNKSFSMEPITLVRDNMNGKARIRVFNAVVGGPVLTVADTKGMTYGPGLKFLGIGDANVDPGTYTFNVVTGANNQAITTANATLDANKLYVLLLSGGKDGNPAVTLQIITNDQDITLVRFVNNGSAGADVYLRGASTPLVTGIASGSTSDYIVLPSGAVTILLRKAASAANSTELAEIEAQLRPGRKVTITYDGSAKLMTITEDGLNQDFAQSGTMASTMASTMMSTMMSTAAR